MKEYTLSQQFAIIGLDGLGSNHPSLAKKSMIRAIVAARCLEQWLPDIETMDSSVFKDRLEKLQLDLKKLRKKEAEEVEAEMKVLLTADGALEETEDLLACDMNYYTAGVNILVYRSHRDSWLRLTEGLRAEVLEDGRMTFEGIFLLWLLRESGCIHDLFSTGEQERIAVRMREEAAANELCRILWEAEFHSGLEAAAVGFLHGKRKLFKNPYLEGVNLLFPFLDRRQAIFIDFVILGTTVAGRRMAIIEFLQSRGHYVEEVKNGEETLLRIDNICYRVFPTTVFCSKLPIQGARLVPAYL